MHPKYKTKYHVTNWSGYERTLVRRGDITVWLSPDAIAAWKPAPNGRRGGQCKFSGLAIEAALTLRLVFHLPLRQAEGFLNSIFNMMGLGLVAPDHTTLSRRSQSLDVELHQVWTGEPLVLIIDSTGLSIVGQGEWATAKHGGKGKRGWKKLHLGVDRSDTIVAQVLTDGTADGGKTGLGLIEAVEGDIVGVVGDAAQDTVAVYDAAAVRSAEVIVPPTRTAVVSRQTPRSTARDRTIKRVEEIGRRRWRKESGYHQQGTVENAFFRYRTIIGARLRACHLDARQTEARIACNALNRMFELGRPASSSVGR